MLPKKGMNKAKTSPKKQAAPKQNGTAATRRAKKWLAECGSDSDETSSSAGEAHGPVPQQAGGAASGGVAAVGQQRGSAPSVGSSSSLGVGTGAAGIDVGRAPVPAIASVVAAVVRQPTAEPSARALRERERRAARAALGVEAESSQRSRVNRANADFYDAEQLQRSQLRSQEIQIERAQQQERDLRARPQHMAELARRRAVVETNAAAELRLQNDPAIRFMVNALGRVQPGGNVVNTDLYWTERAGRLLADQLGPPKAIQCQFHELNVVSSLLLHCSKSVTENVSCFQQYVLCRVCQRLRRLSLLRRPIAQAGLTRRGTRA